MVVLTMTLETSLYLLLGSLALGFFLCMQFLAGKPKYALEGKHKSKLIPPLLKCGYLIPGLGGLIKFVKGPLGVMAEAHSKHGEVFTVPVGNKRMTFLLGPTSSVHFFRGSDEVISQKEVYEFNVPTFGKGVVFDVDHRLRREQFKFFAEALRPSKMRSYVAQMVKEAEDYFGKWGESGEIEILEELSSLIILTASRCLLGREVRENLFEKVYRQFHFLDMGMQPISVLFPYLPIKAHRDRDAARTEMSEIFAKIIRARREGGVVEEDVLQTFVDARYSDAYGGRQMTCDEICGMLIAALFAGQHTSSITSTWTGLYLFSKKYRDSFLPNILEEQRQIVKEHGEELDYEILSKMDYLHRGMKESLRLHPPLIMLMRYVHEGFDVQDSQGKEMHVPKGDVICTSPTFSHRLENVYSNPDTFDPDRFGPGREEDKKKPFSFIGFGGGRHSCMGETFAYMQVKIIWSILLRKFDFELLSNDGAIPEPNYEAMVVGPKQPCKVRYTRRKL
jgi:sterol 14-demethylase